MLLASFRWWRRLRGGRWRSPLGTLEDPLAAGLRVSRDWLRATRRAIAIRECGEC